MISREDKREMCFFVVFSTILAILAFLLIRSDNVGLGFIGSLLMGPFVVTCFFFCTFALAGITCLIVDFWRKRGCEIGKNDDDEIHRIYEILHRHEALLDDLSQEVRRMICSHYEEPKDGLEKSDE